MATFLQIDLHNCVIVMLYPFEMDLVIAEKLLK